MAAIEWKDTLSVNIDSIDNQHKKLFEIINDFYDNIRIKSNDELILELVTGMKDYIVMHFSTEEAYMKKCNYPNFDAHKLEHESFIAKVEELEYKLRSKQTIISFEITSFIKDWIKDHIQETDKQYGPFLIKNSII